MAKECCSGLKHSGMNAECIVKIGEGDQLIYQSTFDSNGNRNFLDLTFALGATNIDALLTNTDKKVRWYPSVKFKDMKLPIADTVFDEAGDGTKSFVRDGIWSINAEIRNKAVHAGIQRRLKQMRCDDVQVYIITKDNQILGSVQENDTKMYGFRLNSGSIDAIRNFKDSQTSDKMMYKVDFDNSEKQENVYALEGKHMATFVDFNNLKMITDAKIAVVGAPTSTTVTFDLKSDFASGLIPNNDILGKDIADFVFTNLTTNAVITPTLVAESTTIDGRYTTTYGSALTSGNVIEISMSTSSGYFGKTTYVTP
jgi:hypothetical protein